MPHYEKSRPKAQVNDELKARRLTYYSSDVPPHQLRASSDMRTDDGESIMSDEPVDEKVLTEKELSDLARISDKVWKHLAAKKNLVPAS
ncbi:MAG: hypothetical protein JRD89_07925 [Deltaproteobacteria bacterium]|nr:hypothetical protein [Deltaproteobacteria bacterium]